MGSGKESISDSMKAASRFVDLIMARLFNHNDLWRWLRGHRSGD